MQFSDKKLRWYDADPTVSMAISVLRNASDENRVIICEKIIQFGLDNEVVVEENTYQKLERFFNRWYDKSRQQKEAMEVMKNLSEEKRKELALDIIYNLCFTEKQFVEKV